MCVLFLFFFFFFFFQAEDGIRDYKVTGVQTCALPICLVQPVRPDRERPGQARSRHREDDELQDPGRAGAGAQAQRGRAEHRVVCEQRTGQDREGKAIPPRGAPPDERRAAAPARLRRRYGTPEGPSQQPLAVEGGQDGASAKLGNSLAATPGKAWDGPTVRSAPCESRTAPTRPSRGCPAFS